ncbi:MAG: hypothetical protein KDB01_19935 [Planctomycetaceae bacterium]|nr:hypothetical protein [Planctomycetaceae bacterium]
MYFRFAAGLMLVVLVSMAGVWLEKQTLEMRRTISVQYYQTDVLFDLIVRLRLETQRLTAPAQMTHLERQNADNAAQDQKTKRPSARTAEQQPELIRSTRDQLPLLRFQHPFNPEGID